MAAPRPGYNGWGCFIWVGVVGGTFYCFGTPKNDFFSCLSGCLVEILVFFWRNSGCLVDFRDFFFWRNSGFRNENLCTFFVCKRDEEGVNFDLV